MMIERKRKKRGFVCLRVCVPINGIAMRFDGSEKRRERKLQQQWCADNTAKLFPHARADTQTSTTHHTHTLIHFLME